MRGDPEESNVKPCTDPDALLAHPQSREWFERLFRGTGLANDVEASLVIRNRDDYITAFSACWTVCVLAHAEMWPTYNRQEVIRAAILCLQQIESDPDAREVLGGSKQMGELRRAVMARLQQLQ
jgi:hypothetical protein